MATGQPHGQPLIAHTNGVTGVAFSPDGKLVASGSRDKTVRLWEVASGQPYGQPLSGHTNLVINVAFSPDGKLVASGSSDKTARLWNLTFSSWTAYGCKMVNQNMTGEEWFHLLPHTPYERTCPDLPAGEGAPSDAPAAQYASVGRTD